MQLIVPDWEPTCEPPAGGKPMSRFNALYATDGYVPVPGCLAGPDPGLEVAD